MIEIDDSWTPPAEQLSELSLSFDQRQSTEILAVQVEEIEREEDALRFPKQKIL
jgi:hypothetical protein